MPTRIVITVAFAIVAATAGVAAAQSINGQNIKGASGPIQIQNGKIISVYPEKLREASPAYPMPCWDKR
jgi:hypothetical protein